MSLTGEWKCPVCGKVFRPLVADGVTDNMPLIEERGRHLEEHATGKPS